MPDATATSGYNDTAIEYQSPYGVYLSQATNAYATYINSESTVRSNFDVASLASDTAYISAIESAVDDYDSFLSGSSSSLQSNVESLLDGYTTNIQTANDAYSNTVAPAILAIESAYLEFIPELNDPNPELTFELIISTASQTIDSAIVTRNLAYATASSNISMTLSIQPQIDIVIASAWTEYQSNIAIAENLWVTSISEQRLEYQDLETYAWNTYTATEAAAWQNYVAATSSSELEGRFIGARNMMAALQLPIAPSSEIDDMLQVVPNKKQQVDQQLNQLRIQVCTLRDEIKELEKERDTLQADYDSRTWLISLSTKFQILAKLEQIGNSIARISKTISGLVADQAALIR